MAMALDIIAVLVIVICAGVGFFRGFVRYVIKMLGTVVCIILAVVISAAAARPIYESVIAPRIESAMQHYLADYKIEKTVDKVLEHYGHDDVKISRENLAEAFEETDNISDAVSAAAGKAGFDPEVCADIRTEMDDFFGEDLNENLTEYLGEDAAGLSGQINLTKDSCFELAKALASEDAEYAAAKYIANEFASDFFVSAVRYVLAVLIYIVAESILAIVFVISGILDRLPVVNMTNRWLGLALGVVKGMLYVTLAALMLSAVFSEAASAGYAAAPSFIDDSVIFGSVYKIVS